jgi:hypothetical protein
MRIEEQETGEQEQLWLAWLVSSMNFSTSIQDKQAMAQLLRLFVNMYKRKF